MSIIEELEKEIAACNIELQKCNAILLQLEERRTCYTEKKEMLEKLLKTASNEQEKTVKPKSRTASIEKVEPQRKADQRKNQPESSDEEPISEIIDGITMKNLAESMKTTTTTIANLCNNLGFDLKMQDNKYLLTKEQAEKVKTAFEDTIIASSEK